MMNDPMMNALTALSGAQRAEFGAWCARQAERGAPPSVDVWHQLAALVADADEAVHDEVAALEALLDDEPPIAGALADENTLADLLAAGWQLDGDNPAQDAP